jgi:hypothetical protein
LSAATKDAKSLAGHIKDATTSLLTWSGIVGVFTGVLGAGGLFGINRLAATTSAQRLPLGIGNVYWRSGFLSDQLPESAGNPTATLGLFAMPDGSVKALAVQAMGINNPDRSPDQLLPQMIRNARDIYVQNGSTLQGAQATA